MKEKPISLEIMELAFNELNKRLVQKITLIMGGGGAMIFAHGFPLATTDVDAIPKGIEIHELNVLVKEVALVLKLPPDWLNCYFSTFAYVVLPDFEAHLITVFSAENLVVKCLSKEDMLIMKCFAHRPKDISHAKALIRAGADLNKVENHIEFLKTRKIMEAQKALDFLDDIKDQT